MEFQFQLGYQGNADCQGKDLICVYPKPHLLAVSPTFSSWWFFLISICPSHGYNLSKVMYSRFLLGC